MIKILLIEDEIPARNKLIRYIEALDARTEIVAEIDTVNNAITFLKQHQVDLIFSDIELLDGNAFDIYSEVKIACPIIFTTAYDQFWMNAFEQNGIDYLLKPFSQERFQDAWNKFIMLTKANTQVSQQLEVLTALMRQNFEHKAYKERFTIHTHQAIYFLSTKDIILYEAHEGVIFAYDTNGKKHLLTETVLKEVEDQLNPVDFFRINRSEIISKNYIEKVERYNKNTLAIKLNGYANYVKTSQSQTANFRAWLEK